MSKLDLDKMAAAIRKITEDRDWDQFHTPKNIAISLSLEATEVLERFQWLTDEQSRLVQKDPAQKQLVADELSDVLYWVVRLADKLEIDLESAFWQKLEKSVAKYPVEKSRGNAKKYTEL